MPGATLAILGASTRAAAFSARRAGVSIVAADLFADADLERQCPVTKVTRYPEDFVEWLTHTACEGWLYTGALENYPALVDRLATIRPLWGNPGTVLRRVRDPLLLQQVFRNCGFAFPETRATSRGLPQDGTWLVKSYSANSGAGITRYRGNSGHYYQKWIEGRPMAALYIADSSQAQLLGITEQLVGTPWTSAAEFQYSGSRTTDDLSPKIHDELDRLGKTLAGQFQLVGLFGVDFLQCGDKIWPVEVNPRYTAAVEVVERAHALSAIPLHLAACRGEHLPVIPRKRIRHFGKAILYARQTCSVSEHLGQQWLSQNSAALLPQIADIPTIGTCFTPGQPMLTVFAEAQSSERVWRQLQERAEGIAHRI